MTRPISRSLLLVFGILTLSACATFSDDNLAARIDDTELGYEEFEQRVRLISNGEDARIPAETGRIVISNWVALELSRDAGLIDLYSAGPTESGVLCVSAANVTDAATGDAAVDELRGGADWETFVLDNNPAANLGGRQDCIPTEAVGELATQLDTMSEDDPFRSLVFQDGSVVVLRMQPVSELSGFDLLRAYSSIDADAVEAVVASGGDRDIYVDPRFGTFDPEQFGVAPLG